MASDLSEVNSEVPFLKLALQIVQRGGKLDELRRLGLLYSQISMLLQNLLEREYVQMIDSGFSITNLGQKFLEEAGESRRRKDGAWISPDLDRKIDQLAESEIYLPSRKVVKNLSK